MAIVIKKRVGFEFLGEEYKDAYLVFKTISVVEYEKVQAKAKTFEDKPEGSIEYMLGLLKSHFVEGKFPDGDVVADDLDSLDAESLIKCFKVFTGQDTDPKVDNGSPTT